MKLHLATIVSITTMLSQGQGQVQAPGVTQYPWAQPPVAVGTVLAQVGPALGGAQAANPPPSLRGGGTAQQQQQKPGLKPALGNRPNQPLTPPKHQEQPGDPSNPPVPGAQFIPQPFIYAPQGPTRVYAPKPGQQQQQQQQQQPPTANNGIYAQPQQQQQPEPEPEPVVVTPPAEQVATPEPVQYAPQPQAPPLLQPAQQYPTQPQPLPPAQQPAVLPVQQQPIPQQPLPQQQQQPVYALPTQPAPLAPGLQNLPPLPLQPGQPGAVLPPLATQPAQAAVPPLGVPTLLPPAQAPAAGNPLLPRRGTKPPKTATIPGVGNLPIAPKTPLVQGPGTLADPTAEDIDDSADPLNIKEPAYPGQQFIYNYENPRMHGLMVDTCLDSAGECDPKETADFFCLAQAQCEVKAMAFDDKARAAKGQSWMMGGQKINNAETGGNAFNWITCACDKYSS